MAKKLTLILIVLLLFLDSQAKSKAPLSIVGTKTVLISHNEDASLLFEPTVFIFEKAGWSERAVIHELQKSSKIFSKCGIQIKSAKIVYVNSPKEGARFQKEPRKQYSFETKFSKFTMNQVAAHFSAYKPALFFVELTGGGVGEGFNEEAVNNIKSFHMTWADNLIGTAWISKWAQYHEKDHESPDYRHPSYSTTAHEIGHLLGLHHDDSRSGNIMSYPYEKAKGEVFEGTRFQGDKSKQPNQCEIIRQSKLLTKKPISEATTVNIRESGIKAPETAQK